MKWILKSLLKMLILIYIQKLDFSRRTIWNYDNTTLELLEIKNKGIVGNKTKNEKLV